MGSNVIPAVQQNTLGTIAYEITNYLGNVNVVISDRKIWNATPTNAFKACIVSRTDYFPFGMEISSRTTNSDNYRFGYNGSDSYRKESDNETKGSGNSYTTEFRQYDPRVGRWLSLDPLMAQFPWQSPYCAFDNNPIYFVDPLGLEGECPGEESDDCSEGDDPKKGSSENPVEYKEVTVNHKMTPTQKLKYLENTLKKDLAENSAQNSSEKKEIEWLKNVNLSYYEDGFTTTCPQRRPFDISTRTAFQNNMNGFSTNFAKGITYGSIAVTSSVALVYAAPTLLAYSGTGLRFAGQGLRISVNFAKQPFVAASGKLGVEAQLVAYYKFGSTGADAVGQILQGNNLSNWNWGSTFGNLYFERPFISNAFGASYSALQGNSLWNVGSNYVVGVVGGKTSEFLMKTKVFNNVTLQHAFGSTLVPLYFNIGNTYLKPTNPK